MRAPPLWNRGRRAVAALILVVTAPLSSGAVSAQEANDVHPLHSRLKPEDRGLAEFIVQETLETKMSRETRNWHNVRTGTRGYVTPLRTFRIRTGHYCREYRESISTKGGLEIGVFTACRDSDGIWQRVR